jgi:hypothetical protein
VAGHQYWTPSVHVKSNLQLFWFVLFRSFSFLRLCKIPDDIRSRYQFHDVAITTIFCKPLVGHIDSWEPIKRIDHN